MSRARAVVFSVGLAGLSLASTPDAESGLAVRQAHAEQATAADCVGFSKTDLERGFEYAISNACSRKLSCTVGWTVSCESADGRVTSRTHQKSNVALAPDGSASITASASSCKQSWSIDDVSWSCSEAK